MRKILFIFLLISTLGFAQTTEVIPNSNFIEKKELIFKDGKLHIEKKIFLENGKNESIPVKLDFFGDETVLNFDLKKVDKIILSAAENAKYKLKSPSTFRPYSIVIRPINKDYWYTNVFFSGENDYGAKKDSSSMAEIDNEGNVLKDYN
ncbi:MULTISPECIES: hypothetical protein [Chryseobacterium]|uniref:Uncharacterized protein n=1 Tax=Chryseobacterium gambrini TaxID=373672 RepID=A0A1N7LGK0_9FLAO|nr:MULTISPECIES: hypothetical protein [Chryseobacterium]SIS72945.1 hypothetical protein SAMN05421785_102221 [Chryseobacterium gambrini]